MKFLILLTATVLSLSVFAQKTTPTRITDQDLFFSDDMDYQNMATAIARQLRGFRAYSDKYTVKFGNTNYTKKDMIQSLTRFKEIMDEYLACSKLGQSRSCHQQLSAKVKNEYIVYQPNIVQGDPRHGTKNTTLFTSYYSPDFHASFTRSDEFKNAIYKMPAGKDRFEKRVAIDFDGSLKGKGYEIAYVKESLYDIYLLHVEGGGRIQVKEKNGEIKYYYLSYKGSNKQSFSFIHKYMVKMGYLSPNNRSVAAQRHFLETNPDKAREIFATCPSYIYFTLTKEEPVGIDGIPLTENRSIALDRRLYHPSGILSFVKTRRPKKPVDFDPLNFDPDKLPTEEYSRFYIGQDTGGAIRGKGRVDLYAGFGEKAEFLANHTKYDGELYFLLLKKQKNE
jgi:membrane-bound lytic murein transglycosylase A